MEPIQREDWSKVERHLLRYPRNARTWESLKRKFHEIANIKPPTGNPTIPPLVSLAKQIKEKINGKSGNADVEHYDDVDDEFDDEGHNGFNDEEANSDVIDEAAKHRSDMMSVFEDMKVQREELIMRERSAALEEERNRREEERARREEERERREEERRTRREEFDHQLRLREMEMQEDRRTRAENRDQMMMMMQFLVAGGAAWVNNKKQDKSDSKKEE